MSLLSSILNTLSDGSIELNKAPECYLACGLGSFQFPIPPSEFKVEVSHNNSVININNIGDLNMLGKTGLKNLTLESFFPAQKYSFCMCTPQKPYSYVNQIEEWRKSNSVAYFRINNTEVNYPVTINKFSWGEKDGSGDVYFSIEMQEYRFVGGAAAIINSISGLFNRGNTALAVVSVLPSAGDEIGDVLQKGLSKNINFSTAATQAQTAYEALAKTGGVTAGTKINITQATGAVK